MSDDEGGTDDPVAVMPVVPVVEISRTGAGGSTRQAWGSDNECEDDFSEVENDEDDDDDALPSPRRSPHSPRRSPQPHRPTPHARFKSTNGKHRVDMTPPEQKLKESEKAAKALAADGEVDLAIQENIRCLAYSRIVYGPSHWKHARSICILGQSYLDLKNYAPQAEYHANNARSILMHGGHAAGSMEEKAQLYAVLIQVYRLTGQACTVLNKYPEAEQALLKADKISAERSKLSCVTDRECDKLDILLFNAMARLYAKQKKFALGSAKFDKLIELMEKEFGTESPQVMKAYMEYGKLESAQGRHANHEKIIQLFLQAHSIASAIYKEGHAELVDTALALSEAYANTGWEEAEGSAVSYLEECVSMCTASRGPDHPRTLSVQDQLCKLLVRTGRTEDALTILNTSLPIKCEVFSDYSEPVADTYKLLASIHLSEGNLDKAGRLYKKCHNIQVAVLGKRHRKSADTLKTLELLMASPGVNKNISLNPDDELAKRPRFNGIVARQK